MILLIDNYDSFTHNLYQALLSLGQEVQVVRNDAVTVEEVLNWSPSHIVLSPGPKTPSEAGICLELIKKSAGKIPLLGVCLGHQAIAQAFGGLVISAQAIRHGKTSLIHHNGEGIFKNIPNSFLATRYHSLVVDRNTLPVCLEVTATSEDQEIMALRHKKFPIHGVQFHPESVLTTVGPQILQNFICTSQKQNPTAAK